MKTLDNFKIRNKKNKKKTIALLEKKKKTLRKMKHSNKIT